MFEEAVDAHAPAQWPAFVLEASGGDDEIAQEVHRLLEAHCAAGDFMAAPVAGGLAQRGDLSGASIGPYRLTELIGEGGMGVVYAAEQLLPIRREVALKVIKSGCDSRDVIARFETERQALALMDHPHIARIFDAGTADGRPYFVMELVRGAPITEYCQTEHVALAQRLRLFITVCRAVQHAHQRGVIHRDLKPQNVLVARQDGQPLVKVIDFGVAKATAAALASHTVYATLAQFVGTPLYMSPEQAGGSGDIDTRSDVYSLGVLLYELLTGETPVDRETLRRAGLDEFRRMLREDDPPRPSARLARQTSGKSSANSTAWRRVRGELDWIVMKALEKDRDRRYESAAALADDVARFLDHQPIQARPPSGALRVRKWSRRHPLLAFAALAGCALAALVVAGIYWHTQALEKSLAESDELRKAGLTRERALRQQLVATDTQLAFREALGGQVTAAKRLLHEHLDGATALEQQGFAWHYVNYLCSGPQQVYEGHAAPLLCADLSRDDRLLASGDKGGGVKIWEVQSGRAIRSLSYGTQEVCAVRFSPDGKWLATAGQDRRVHLWEVATWKQVAVLDGHERTIYSLAWSPDSQWLASGGRDAQVIIWSAATWEARQRLADGGNQDRAVRALAWSSDGSKLAVAKGGQEMLVLETSTWTPLRSLPGLDNNYAILACAFTIDDRYLTYGGYGGMLRVFDFTTASELPWIDCANQVFSLTVLGEGVLVVGGNRGATQVIDIWENPPRLHTRRVGVGEQHTLRAVLPSHDGEFLITAAEEPGVMKRWDAGALSGMREMSRAHPLYGVHEGQDRGEDWHFEINDRQVHVRDIATGAPLATLRFAGWSRPRPEFAPRRKLLAVANTATQLQLWDTETWRVAREIDVPAGELRELAFSADEEWIVATCLGGWVGLWRFDTGAWDTIIADQSQKHWSTVEASPTAASWAVVPPHTTTIELRRFGQTAPYASCTAVGGINTLVYSPDGQWLAAGDADDVISVFDAATGAAVGSLRGHTREVLAVSFSPDGDTIASASGDGTIRLWSLATRRELFVLHQHQRPVVDVWFLSRDRLVAIDELRRTLLIFDAAGSR